MENNSQKNITPTLVFIFGGSGDLNNRKLTPALFNLFADGFLDANFKIFGIVTSGKPTGHPHVRGRGSGWTSERERWRDTGRT